MAAGFRSSLAFWMGGAGAETTQVGVRGLLAFWMGGADTVTATPPQPPIVTGGGSYRRRPPFRIPVDPLQAQRLDEDELIVLVIASALPLLH